MRFFYCFIMVILLSACTSTMNESGEGHNISLANETSLAVDTNGAHNEKDINKNDGYANKYDNLLNAYPTNYINIVSLFKGIDSIKKDEFTSSAQYNADLICIFSKLNILNKPYILKISKTRSPSYPQLVYNADTGISKIEFSINHIWSSRYSSKEESFFGHGERYVEVINIDSKLKETEETGYNIFGLSNTYTRVRGDEYSVFFTNFYDISDFSSLSVSTNRINLKDAKSLKSNIEIYFVVKLPDSYTGAVNDLIFNKLNTETPNIDSFLVYNTMQHVIKLDLISILICDKKKKEVIDVITNFN